MVGEEELHFSDRSTSGFTFITEEDGLKKLHNMLLTVECPPDFWDCISWPCLDGHLIWYLNESTVSLSALSENENLEQFRNLENLE